MVPVSVITTHKNIMDTDIHNNLRNYRLLVPPRQKEARREALSAPKPGCSGTIHIAVRETGSAKATLPFFLHKCSDPGTWQDPVFSWLGGHSLTLCNSQDQHQGCLTLLPLLVGPQEALSPALTALARDPPDPSPARSAGLLTLHITMASVFGVT